VVRKFSDAERERILAEACATLQRGEAERYAPPAEPREDSVAKWKREADEQEQRFARERKRQEERPLERRIAALEQQLADARSELRAEIDQRIANERQFMLEVVGEALGEAWATQRADAKNELNDELRSLRIDLCELQTTLCELRQVIAADHGSKVIDLPNPLRRVN
jgi:hypothetical protein